MALPETLRGLNSPRLLWPLVYAAAALAWLLGAQQVFRVIAGEQLSEQAAMIVTMLILVATTTVGLYGLLKVTSSRRHAESDAPVAALSGTQFAMIFLAVFAALAAVAAYAFVTVRQDEYSRTERQLVIEAEFAAAELKEALRDHAREIMAAARSPFLEQAVLSWARGETGVELKLQEGLGQIRDAGGFRSVRLARTDGATLLTIGAPGGAVPAGAPDGELGVAVSSLQRERDPDGEVIVSLAVPIQLPEGPAEAALAMALVATVPLVHLLDDYYSRALAAAGQVSSASSLTVFHSEDGEVRRVTLSGTGAVRNFDLVPAQAMAEDGCNTCSAVLAGATGLIEGTDHSGAAVLAIGRRVAGTGWYVSAGLSKAFIESGPQRTRLAIGALLMLALLAIALALLWTRRLVARSAAAARRDAESQLRLTTRHFEQANRYANDIILLIDPDGRIAEANQRAIEAYGLPRAELIGSKAEDLLAKTGTGRARVQRFEDTDSFALLFETVHRRRDGTEFPVEVSARRFDVRDRMYSQAIVRDISERKAREAEFARVAAERDAAALQLRRQFDDMPFGCVVTDRDLRIVDANPAFERLFGWQKRELLGDTDFDKLVVAEDRAAVTEVISSVRRVTGHVGHVNRNVTRDGRQVLCRWTNTSLRGADGEFLGVLCMCEDLSGLESLQREVSAQAGMFRALAETAPVGVFQIAADGQFGYANPTLVNMLGASATSPQELAKGLFLAPEDRARAARLRRDVMAGEIVAPQEFRYAGPDGVKGWLLVQAQAVKDSSGTVVHVVGTATDVTSLKEHEATLERRVEERTLALNAAKDNAERANAVKTAFLASMSHELRTPLNSVVGFTDTLLEKTAGPLNDKQELQLTIVRDAARRLRVLIGDLLDISRVESGRLAVERSRVDAADLVRRVVAEFDADARSKGLSLTCDVSGAAGAFETDPGRCAQIVANLVSNAIKYTQAGSVSVEARLAGGALRVSVTDTGIGISAADLERIFEPFVQLPPAPGRPYRGVGLGLALSRKLAGALGGTIQASSEPGRGSLFVLRLPGEARTTA